MTVKIKTATGFYTALHSGYCRASIFRHVREIFEQRLPDKALLYIGGVCYLSDQTYDDFHEDISTEIERLRSKYGS